MSFSLHCNMTLTFAGLSQFYAHGQDLFTIVRETFVMAADPVEIQWDHAGVPDDAAARSAFMAYLDRVYYPEVIRDDPTGLPRVVPRAFLSERR